MRSSAVRQLSAVKARQMPPAILRLAAAIKKARRRKGWSQENLASVVGMQRDVIKRIEGGKTDPRCSVIFQVLPALGLDEQELRKIIYGQKGANRVPEGDTES